MMPEFIWLATGGKSGFNDRVEVLDGRKVIAFPMSMPTTNGVRKLPSAPTWTSPSPHRLQRR